MKKKPIVVTSGEPAGIGLDIVIKLFSSRDFVQSLAMQPVCILADAQSLLQRAQQMGVDIFIHTIKNIADADAYQHECAVLNVYDIPCSNSVVAGKLDTANAQQVLNQLSLAAQLSLAGDVSAIVTAPVQKSVINDAIAEKLVDMSHPALQKALCSVKPEGYFSGHTEFFQHMADCDDVVMMLANDTLKVALVTTHIPLKDVAHAVTTQKLTTVFDIVLADMQTKFGRSAPHIKVCGLNPHAGEGGHMGMEEITTINPLLETYRATQAGKNISLALPADTLFNPQNLEKTDCFVAMYHDQGLTVLKALGFGKTVNLTLGLPFIRTSVDHGTALDIAGTGVAGDSSLKQAIVMAVELSQRA